MDFLTEFTKIREEKEAESVIETASTGTFRQMYSTIRDRIMGAR